ncbi:NnrS family protein [Paracoccus jeotgali]|uniref:NnrS family protein n=1 Tax=Paracoccus jeotgali TaxID=2065379 RepID=UPI0035E400C6
MDRVAEAFVGREACRAEILLLAGSAALAGAGLLVTGAALIGAPWSEVTGLHLAFMGGLGLGVYAVFCIAGLLHTNQPLGLSRMARLGALLLVAATAMRVAPDLGVEIPGPLYGVASVGWAAAFLLWLADLWPSLQSLPVSGATEEIKTSAETSEHADQPVAAAE